MSDKRPQNQNTLESQQALQERQFQNLRLASIFLFPVAAFIAFRARDIFFLLPKETPASSILPLQIIIWAAIFAYYNVFLMAMAWLLNKKQIIVSALVIGLVSFLPFNFYFIPRYGSVGFPATILVVSAITLAFMMFSFSKIGINIPIYKSCEKPAVASMGMMLVLHYTNALGFAAVFAAAAVSYVLILFTVVFLEK